MKVRLLSSRILFVVGSVAMLIGILDPLEGSLIILPGSALALLGVALGKRERRVLIYWVWVFALIGVGVGALFALSSVGGFGGTNGRSMLWGLTILPYPIGWIMGVRGIVVKIVEVLKARHQAATSS
jgi:hypothetical protein